jgi:uncharacterized protein YndB with AHSA1/START domain
MKKILIGLFVMAVLFMGCHSSKKAIEQSQSFPKRTNWPEQYKPDNSKFFVHNHIEINASPAQVWEVLIQAESWPEWYEGAKNVHVENSGDGRLNENSVFIWNTMGLNFDSIVKEFIPPYRLAWESKKKSIQGYHSWVIIPTDFGCTVITDESQKGWLTFMEKTFQPDKLYHLHEVWLSELKKKVERQFAN